jgi:hypothetical protein
MAGDFGSHRTTQGAAGYYTRSDGVDPVWVKQEELADPEALVATMAHELGHVVMLGRGDVARRAASRSHHRSRRDLSRSRHLHLEQAPAAQELGGRQPRILAASAKGLYQSRDGRMGVDPVRLHTRRIRPEMGQILDADGKGYLKQGLRYLQKTGDQSFLTK